MTDRIEITIKIKRMHKRSRSGCRIRKSSADGSMNEELYNRLRGKDSGLYEVGDIVRNDAAQETVSFVEPHEWGADDPLFPEALRLAAENGTVYAAYLQRKLSIGYTRAVKMIDAMEEKGCVCASDGHSPRKVLITAEQLHEMKFGNEA